MVVVALHTVVPRHPKGSMPWPIRHTALGVSQRRLNIRIGPSLAKDLHGP